MTATHTGSDVPAPAPGRRDRRRLDETGRIFPKFSPAARVTLFFVIVTTQIPFLITLYQSLQRWNLMEPNNRGFVGLRNYATVFELRTFWPSLWNTARMTVGAVALTLVVGTALALLLNRPFRGRAVVRTLIFCAFLVPPSASALLWKTTMLDPSNGLVSFLLTPFGGRGVDWVNTSSMGTVVFVTAWQWIPFAMLIILAGLQNEDRSLRDAAMVDGAGPVRIFRSLTLPHLRPHLEVSALLGSIFISQLLDPIMLITQGGLGTSTTTAAYQLQQLAFRSFNVGLASAYGVVVVLITIAVTLLLLRFAVRSLREVR